MIPHTAAGTLCQYRTAAGVVNKTAQNHIHQMKAVRFCARLSARCAATCNMAEKTIKVRLIDDIALHRKNLPSLPSRVTAFEFSRVLHLVHGKDSPAVTTPPKTSRGDRAEELKTFVTDVAGGNISVIMALTPGGVCAEIMIAPSLSFLEVSQSRNRTIRTPISASRRS